MVFQLIRLIHCAAGGGLLYINRHRCDLASKFEMKLR
jgi:hypothetical protein